MKIFFKKKEGEITFSDKQKQGKCVVSRPTLQETMFLRLKELVRNLDLRNEEHQIVHM